MGEPPLAALHKGRVNLGVEDGLELLLLLAVVAEQVGPLSHVLLGLDLLHGLVHDRVYGLLVLLGEVKVEGEARRSLEPPLEDVGEAGLLLGCYQLLQLLGLVLVNPPVIRLIVSDSVPLLKCSFVVT